MKNLIRKILKEQENEFEWVKEVNPEEAEKVVRRSFRDIDYEWGVDYLDDVYPFLIEYGITNPNHLIEIGKILYNKAQRLHDSGYESGQDDCSCDYCCDDMYHYEDVREKEQEARDEGREEGYDNGFEEGKRQSEDKIEELEGQIQELQSTIEELRSERGD